MKTIEGIINCKETPDIPPGSVVYITISKDSKIIGHQTLQCIDKFPFAYQVEVEHEPAQDKVQTWSIRVNIENGESTIFLNDTCNFMPLSEGNEFEKLDIELKTYLS